MIHTRKSHRRTKTKFTQEASQNCHYRIFDPFMITKSETFPVTVSALALHVKNTKNNIWTQKLQSAIKHSNIWAKNMRLLKPHVSILNQVYPQKWQPRTNIRPQKWWERFTKLCFNSDFMTWKVINNISHKIQVLD